MPLQPFHRHNHHQHEHVGVEKAFEGEWRYANQAARSYEDEWALALDHYRQAVGDHILANRSSLAFQQGDPRVVLSQIDWEAIQASLGVELTKLIERTLVSSGRHTMRELGIPLSFEAHTTFATDWVMRNSAKLVTEITTEQRLAISNLIVAGFRDGTHPYRWARLLKSTVGLTQRQSQAVTRYWLKLNADSNLSQARVDQLAKQYANRLWTYRAHNIARTETVNGLANGQQNAWLQARNHGFLSPNVQRVWIAADESPRTCDICLDLDGQKVGLDQPFFSGVLGIQLMTPTAHPSCRCAVGLANP